MMAEHTVVFAGGGSGGHVYPALAVADALSRINGACRMHFAGTASGVEATVVPAAGYSFFVVPSRGLRGKPLLEKVVAIPVILKGIWAAWGFLRRPRPDVVVATSGYAAVPVAVSAWLQRIPLVLLEQNVKSGWTTRALRPLASRLVMSFLGSPPMGWRGRHVLVLGNPLRREALEGNRVAARRQFGLPASATVIAVVGGSQGATSLNDAVLEALPRIVGRRSGTWVVWCTGRADERRIQREVERRRIRNVVVRGYVEKIGEVYASADLVVSRAGGGTLMELAAWKLPAVLVPLEGVAGDHQVANARWMVEHGAALMVRRDGSMLAQAVLSLLHDRARRKDMAAKSRVLGRPEAAREVAHLIRSVWTLRRGEKAPVPPC